MARSDARLIDRAKDGDPRAFTALYDRHQPRVYRYIYFRVNDATTAEDLTGEVFVRLVKNITHFRNGRQPFIGWLYTTAGDAVNDYQRNYGQPQPMPAHRPPLAPDSASGNLPLASVNQERLALAMEQLPEEERLMILMRFFEDDDPATIAGVLDKTGDAVKALQHRALMSLSRFLAGSAEDMPAEDARWV